MIVRDLDKEEKEAKKSFRFLRDETGRALLDCGANVGFVSEWMIGKFKRIYAVEAHPETYKRLAKRMKRYPSITPINASVFGAKPPKDLFISSPRNSTGATVTASKRRKQPGYYARAGKPTSLFELIRKTRADVIKLDIEGCEYDALTGNPLTGVRVVVVEFHGTRGHRGYLRYKAADKWMRGLGFKRTHPRFMNMLPDGSALKAFYFVARYER